MKKYLLLFILSIFLSACPGTETGNPAFTNSAEGISTHYPSSWTYSDREAPPQPQAYPTDGPPADVQPRIPIGDSPSTYFTDGQSSVTIYYVTLPAGTDLLAYLQTIFSSRTFTNYSNGSISGYFYNNTEAGATGGDLMEYYFLQGTKMIYVVTDLFPASISSYITIVESLRYQ